MWTIIAALCLASPLAAQTVVGTVSDDATGEPIVGALVTLVAEVDGREAAQRLTDAEGAYALRTVRPGRYRVRVQMLGYATTATDPFRLDAGASLRRDVGLPAEAIRVEGVTADVERRCRDVTRDGARIEALWREAKKALAVAAWTEELAATRFEWQTYTRRLEPRSERLLAQNTEERTNRGTHPFASLPAERLSEEGYWVRSGEGDRTLYGPDARVILSDAFLEDHCFDLAAMEAPDDGLVGLAFEPVRGRRSRPEVRGALWLDSATAAPHSIDYVYTTSPWPEIGYDPHGRLRFAALPNGVWTIAEWWIRMPVPTTARFRNLRGSRYVGAIAEDGGRITLVRMPDGARFRLAGTGVFAGVVHDSAAGGPLAGARVRLLGTAYRAVADSAGRFRLPSVLPGTYEVVFEHARLAALGWRPEPAPVRVEADERTTVSLALPPLATALASGCEPEPGGEDSGIVVGRVLEAGSGLPLADARVRLVPAAGADEAAPLEATTDRSGRFRFCAVPPGIAWSASATLLGGRTAPVTVRSEAGRPVAVELSLALEDAIAETAGGGRVRVSGRVLDAATDEPIVGAEVRLVGTGAVGATDAEGRFVFDGVAPGPSRLEISHLAYGTRTQPLEVEPGRATHVEARLPAEAIELEGIEVTVERRHPKLDLAGFYRRQAKGWGQFLTREEIEEMNSSRITHALGRLPGVRLRTVCPGGVRCHAVPRLRPRGGPRGDCPPVVYIDGQKVRSDAGGDVAIDDFVSIADVEAIEVYRRATELPPEYGGGDAACGVVVVWTR